MLQRVRGSATEVAGVHLFNGKLKLMAAATMKGGALAAAVETCERAIALFEGEVASGVGMAAEEMLLRACCERRSAAEAEEKQRRKTPSATREG